MSCEDGVSIPWAWSDRGQSETLGFVLVFSIMVIGALLVVALGATAISDTEEQLDDDRAEKAMTQFDSKAGLVALGEADSQRVSFAAGGDGLFRIRENMGWMKVSFTNRTDNSQQQVMNTTLGAMTYETDEIQYAYQGGGVWQNNDHGGKMVSPPEFHYRNGTLTLPAVSVTGDTDIGSAAIVSQNSVNQTFPVEGDPLLTNPLDNHLVTVTVHSEFYRGWGQYFEERTDGSVQYDDDNKTATLELVVPANHPEITSGVFSESGSSLDIGNNGEVRSYNSSTPGFVTEGEGKVVTSGDLHLQGEVYGDLEVGGELTTQASPEVINGNISHADGSEITVSDCGGEWNVPTCPSSKYWIANNASVTEPDSVTRLVESRLDEIKSNNDNSIEDDIDDSTNSLDCSGTCNITAGKYYMDNFDVDVSKVILNTTAGDIDIAIGDDFTIDNGNEVNVTGSNRVNVYLNDSFSPSNNAIVGNETIQKPSSQFWLYVHPQGNVDLINGLNYTGVIYGPGGEIGDGADINFGSSGCGTCYIHGAIVGNITSQVNGHTVYYDSALSGVETVETDSDVVVITYLHVTINNIRIERG